MGTGGSSVDREEEEGLEGSSSSSAASAGVEGFVGCNHRMTGQRSEMVAVAGK